MRKFTYLTNRLSIAYHQKLYKYINVVVSIRKWPVRVSHIFNKLFSWRNRSTLTTRNRGGSRISSKGGALTKIAPSGGMRDNFWGISCEKSRFYPKKSYFFPILGGARRVPPPWIHPCISKQP